jgi:hypothetical protein
MQLLLSTAREQGVAGIDKDAKANIRAGAAYMRCLEQTYVNDPGMDEKNGVLMTFAAYNAGPGNLQKFRRLARQDGLDPNIWFSKVEIEAAKVAGAETVQYVSNIYKYYIAYSLLLKRQAARRRPSRRSKLRWPPQPRRRVIAPLQMPLQMVSDIFITHLHADHFAEFPYLYCFAPWMGRWKPLRVSGPSGRTPQDGIKNMIAVLPMLSTPGRRAWAPFEASTRTSTEG